VHPEPGRRRRRTLSLTGGTAIELDFGRNLTGRVDFFVNGSLDVPPSTSELIAHATRTRYFDDQAAEFRYAEDDVTVRLTNYHPGRKHTGRPSISLHRIFEPSGTPLEVGRTLQAT
jgi:hypothetical protein